MFDHGHISSYEGHKERRTGKIRGAFSRMNTALDAWMLAHAPASPAQGLHHHGRRYFNFSYFCTVSGTRFSMLDWVRVTGLSCTKGVWYIYDRDTGQLIRCEEGPYGPPLLLDVNYSV